MAYTTAAKVRELLTGVSSTNDTLIDTMIARADKLINAKVGVKYTVPFSTTPPIIEVISTEIAAYYTMRTFFTQDSQNRNDWILNFKECMNQLEQIANGTMLVLDSSGNQLSFNGSPLVSNTKDYTPVFDMDSEENWAVDSDLLDSISTDRD